MFLVIKMKQPNRFLIGIFSLFLTTVLVIGILLFYLWNNLSIAQTQLLMEIINNFPIPIVAICIIFLGVFGFGVESIYKNYVYPLKRISSEASIIYSSNPSHRLKVSGSKDIHALTGIINDFADIFENLSKDITEQILSARKETEKERNLLAAIMAELPEGVIICNKSGRILLFNSLAKKLFTHQSNHHRAEQFIGLGRSIFHLIDKELIVHAIEEIEERLNNEETSLASYFITPIYTGILLSIETIPVLDKTRLMTGFILTFKDISNQVDQYENIDNWLLSFKQKMLSQFDQTKVFIQDLIEMPVKERGTEALYTKEIKNNIENLEKQFNKTSHSILDATLSKLPLTKLDLSQFLISIQNQTQEQNGIKLLLNIDTEYKRMLADSYSLNMAFIFLIVNLSDITGKREFNLNISSIDNEILFDINWFDAPASQIQIENIITKKIRSLPSFGYVLKQNRSNFSIISEGRPEFYDID